MGLQGLFWVSPVVQVTRFQVVFTYFLVPGSCRLPDPNVLRILKITLYAIVRHH